MGLRRKINTICFSLYLSLEVNKIYCQLLQMSILGQARTCQDGATIKTLAVEIIKRVHSLSRKNGG